MKNIRHRKNVLFIIAVFYFLSILLVFSPTVMSATPLCTFENYAIGETYIDEYAGGTHWLNATREVQNGNGIFRVENQQSVFGEGKIFHYDEPAGSHGTTDYVNFSFLTNTTIVEFDWDGKFENSAEWYFAYEFYDINGEMLGYIKYGRFGAPVRRVDIKAGSTTRIQIFGTSTQPRWFNTYARAYANNSFYINIENNTGGNEHVWGTVSGYDEIKYMYWRVYSGFVLPTLNTQMDNLSTDWSYVDINQTVSQYCYTGDLANKEITFTGFSMGHDKVFHEGRYNSAFDNTVRQVDIIVYDELYELYANPSYYRMNLNGVIYTANNVERISVNDVLGNPVLHYLVSWVDIDVAINHKWLNFAFGIYYNGAYRNWQYLAQSPNDINNDGEIQRRWHTETWLFEDSVYDGSLKQSSEIAFRFWHDCIEADAEDVAYEYTNDTIFISPADNGSLEYNVGDTIGYIAYSQDMINQPYVYINKDGSNIDIITMTSQLYYGFYTVNSAGSYNITLVRNSIWRAGKNFTVYDLNPDTYIYTDPQVTRPMESYLVKYKYTHAQGYDGRIILSTSNDFDDEDSYIADYNIVNNTESSFTYSHLQEQTYYWYLCVVYPNNNTYMIEYHEHYCESPRDNYLTHFKDNVNLYIELTTNYQRFWYGHTFPTWQVDLKLNAVVEHDISYPTESSLTHWHYTSGDINATMELLTDEGYIILKYTFYTVGGAVTDPDTEQAQEDIHNIIDAYFDDGQQIILGLGIIVISACIPMWLVNKYQIRNVPTIFYLIFPMIGFGLDIYLQLFDVYMIVLFGFGFTAIIVFYLLGSGFFSQTSGTYAPDNNNHEQAQPRVQRYTQRMRKYRSWKSGRNARRRR